MKSDPLAWRQAAAGIDYALVPLAGRPGLLACIRLDPARVRFSLHTVSEDGGNPVALDNWMARHDLDAAINSSMYLPDMRTSIGYLRNQTHENNRRIAGNLGAFFVAEPLEPGLPGAAILDREADDFRDLLPRYAVVVQNFRLFNRQGNILWAQGGNEHSIAAVGQGGDGAIYFFHCGAIMNVHDFTAMLLALPLDLTAAMYVEGGSDAQLCLRADGQLQFWSGQSSLLRAAYGRTPLPNILGARLRERPAATDS